MEKTLLERTDLHSNMPKKFLIEETVKSGYGKLSKEGSLVVKTGEKTGRSAKDKYVVESDYVNSNIDWANDVNKMNDKTFKEIKARFFEFYETTTNLYYSKKAIGSIDKYSMNVELMTTHPSFSLFFDNMFRDLNENAKLEDFKVYHAPALKLDAKKWNLVSGTCIAINFTSREVLVCGSFYSGEIKKAIFSVMNFILPEMEVLPMHSGASVDSHGNTSVFFGLSGTGKTTLSTDQGTMLIGDDEHGMCEDGVFNFEGGCYAKTYKLSKTGEPEIYKAALAVGSLLENVTLLEDGSLDFDDATLTENGRASYDLDLIDEKIENGFGPVSNNVFLLTADAFGVLPPVSKLSPAQAEYYFLSGYTAKVAGTEEGVTEPQATFSTCFGAPFMMRKATDYSKLLSEYIKKQNINLWLVNTGWTGGAYGVGSRFPLKVTREIIRGIQAGKLDNAEFKANNPFELAIPTNFEGVDNKYLDPKETWTDKEAYDKQADKLLGMFKKNYVKFQ
jgi:phosphoenolpyruvate carboxykinase (ATP)